MTFAEMRANYDSFSEYSDWSTVDEFYRKGLIDADSGFPRVCGECGSEVIMKNSMTQIMCCNPNCRKKASFRLAKLIENLGYKGMGESAAGVILWNATNAVGHDLESFLDVFCIPEEDWNQVFVESAIGNTFFSMCEDLKTRQFTFGELFSKLAIPGFGSEAAGKFADIESVTDFFNQVQNDGIQEFLCKRGIHTEKAANQIYQNLHNILAIERAFPNGVRMTGSLKFAICITGNISLGGKSITKSNFVRLINEADDFKIDGRPLFEITNNSAIQTNHFVLCSAPSNSAKYRVAKERGVIVDEFGEHPVLMTPDDFIRLLLDGYERVKARVMAERPGIHEVHVIEVCEEDHIGVDLDDE